MEKSLYDMNQETTAGKVDNTQAALAVAGMAPGPTGMSADLLSAALYAKEGDWKNTLWSLASFVPVLGMAAGARRIRNITKLRKYEDTIKEIKRIPMSAKRLKKVEAVEKRLEWYNHSMQGKARRSRVIKQGGNDKHPSIRNADSGVEGEIRGGLTDALEGHKSKIILDRDLDNLSKGIVTPSKRLSTKEQIRRQDDALFRRLGGLQRGSRRSGKK